MTATATQTKQAKQKKQEFTKPFGEATEADIAAADYHTLRRWSISADLGADGKSADIRERLTAAISGASGPQGKHTHGRTPCEICGKPARVTNTKRTKMADGRTLVTRQMKCTGKHKHTYPLKKIE